MREVESPSALTVSHSCRLVVDGAGAPAGDGRRRRGRRARLRQGRRLQPRHHHAGDRPAQRALPRRRGHRSAQTFFSNAGSFFI